MENYEQKYKEALARVKYLIEGDDEAILNRDDLETVFPELKENNKDEKIRKELIVYFQDLRNGGSFGDITNDDIIAWLEKQGEQNSVDEDKPKFEVGDWITDGKEVGQVIKWKHLDCIGYKTNYGTEKAFLKEQISRWHKWTIQDAKAGDVLYLQKDGKEHIIIYKGVRKERFRTFVSAYCAYNGIVDAFCFADVSRYIDIAYGGIMPATKEQRTELFLKMHEAGYEWDEKKLELKQVTEN